MGKQLVTERRVKRFLGDRCRILDRRKKPAPVKLTDATSVGREICWVRPTDYFQRPPEPTLPRVGERVRDGLLSPSICSA